MMLGKRRFRFCIVVRTLPAIVRICAHKGLLCESTAETHNNTPAYVLKLAARALTCTHSHLACRRACIRFGTGCTDAHGHSSMQGTIDDMT